MTESELLEQMVIDAHISSTEANAALNSVIKNITETLMEKNGEIELVGFGTFSNALRNSRLILNPITGEEIKIKASIAIRFESASKLKNIVQLSVSSSD